MSWDLAEGAGQGDWPPFFDARRRRRRRADRGGVRRARRDGRSRRPVEPSGRGGAGLDLVRRLAAQRGRAPGRAAAARARRARAGRRLDGAALAARRSCAMISAAGAEEIYGYERWEGLRLAAGSAALALRMADGLGDRLRLGARVTALDVAPGVSRVTLADGRGAARRGGRLRAAGRPAARRRDQRRVGRAAGEPAPPAPGARREARRRLPGAGLARGAAPAGSPTARGSSARPGRRATTRSRCWSRPSGSRTSWPRRPSAAAPRCSTRSARLYGEPARAPDALLERAWGVDPLTQGYVAQWAPGDLMAVGPLHGTHEPPFYVCGSDHWVAGYMEGAVRTGRAAAAAALGRAPAARARSRSSAGSRGRSAEASPPCCSSDATTPVAETGAHGH